MSTETITLFLFITPLLLHTFVFVSTLITKYYQNDFELAIFITGIILLVPASLVSSALIVDSFCKTAECALRDANGEPNALGEIIVVILFFGFAITYFVSSGIIAERTIDIARKLRR